jgi:hypothetical protein
MSEAELHVMQALMRSSDSFARNSSGPGFRRLLSSPFSAHENRGPLSDVTTDPSGQASILGRTCSIEPS